jgi:hypothetical protein
MLAELNSMHMYISCTDPGKVATAKILQGVCNMPLAKVRYKKYRQALTCIRQVNHASVIGYAVNAKELYSHTHNKAAG